MADQPYRVKIRIYHRQQASVLELARTEDFAGSPPARTGLTFPSYPPTARYSPLGCHSTVRMPNPTYGAVDRSFLARSRSEGCGGGGFCAAALVLAFAGRALAVRADRCSVAVVEAGWREA